MLTNTVELRKITFIGVPTESSMHYRPYRANVDGEIINDIANLTRGGSNIGTGAFTDISGRVISPSSQSMGVLSMPYGWEQKRYSVMMEFDVITAFGVTREIIMGYTGYDNITPTGALDPAMPIFINSYTSAKSKTNVQNNIRRSHYASNGAKQILSDVHYVDGASGNHVVADTLMRPTDTFHCNQREESQIVPAGTIDTRSTMVDTIVPSNRDNVIGSRYLSKVCQGYKNALVQNPDFADQAGVVYGDAAMQRGVDDGNMEINSLFDRLKRDTDYISARSVTVGELARCWPNIHDDRTKTVIHMAPSVPTTTVDVNQHWGGANLETKLAYMLCQAVPALMNSYLFSEFTFAMHNKTIDGSINIALLGQPMFMVPVADDLFRIQAMEANLASDIAGQILSAGVSDFEVMMECRILGSNQVNIAVNGQQPVPFSAPAYCDSTYTPVVGESSESLVNLSNDLRHMLSGVFGGEGYSPIVNNWDSGPADTYGGDNTWPEINNGGF